MSYRYDNTNWRDLLTSVGGKTITYDGNGNMLTYNGSTFTWAHGRELLSLTKNGVTWTNTYNADGIRTKRTNGSTTYNYVYNGSSLSQMTIVTGTGDTAVTKTLNFVYDASGSPMAVTYNGTTYYYVTNLQGDVIAILDSAGTAVVEYSYNAWGMLLSTVDDSGNNLGEINPLRYRGYVYDDETGLYYLQSRYYDPEIGRFINIDAFIATGQGILGNNAFAYCLNNPVCYMDSRGYFAISATLAATNWWNPVGWVSAAVLVIESIVFTVGVLVLTYELLKPIFDVDLSGKNNPETSGQSAQISGTQASPATPEPPNKNNKNNKGLSLKRITSQLLKREEWDAHQIKREYLGQKAEISKYDLAYNTNNGDVYIITKDGTIVTDTIYNLWEHTPML